MRAEFLVFLALLALPAAGRAAGPAVWNEDEPEAGEPGVRRALPRSRPRVFWQADFYTRDGAFEKDDADIERFGGLVLGAGYDSVLGETRRRGGLGFRAGVLFPTRWGLEAGGSAGYVFGPSQDIAITGFSAAAGDGRVDDETDSAYWRFLVEALKEFRLSRTLDLRLRAGAGVAAGRLETRQKVSGTFRSTFGLPADATFTERWTGFTWEAIPSLVLKGRKTSLEVGFGWAGFPRLKENADFNEFRWTPVGLRLGLEFR